MDTASLRVLVLITAVVAVVPAAAQSPHPSVRVGSAITLDLRARVEGDTRLATPEIGRTEAAFAWRNPRLGLEGKVHKAVSFEYSHELGDAGQLKDAYLNVRFSRALEIEGGRFKLPMSPDALTGRHNLGFVNRSLVGRILAPGRDVGVMAHGRWLGKMVTYQAGYFLRDGDNARTSHTRGGRDVVGVRVSVKPLARANSVALAPLTIGTALLASRLDGGLGLRGETVFGDGVFFDRVYVNGRRWRQALEATWESGPASVSAEYIAVADQREGEGFAGESLTSVRARGWYVAGTWVVTGERKDGWVEPRLALTKGGAGAVEVALRVEGLRFNGAPYPGVGFGFFNDTRLLANAEHAATVGINWYFDGHVRIQGNLVFESVDDPRRSPAPTSAGRFASGVIRLQFVL